MVFGRRSTFGRKVRMIPKGKDGATKKVPTFLPEEEQRLHLINSFKFNHCNSINNEFAERALLYKARRVYEGRLEKHLREKKKFQIVKKKGVRRILAPSDRARKLAVFEIYIQLGHVHLLSCDYPKSMAAYQHAFKLHQHKFRTNPRALYGLGMCYFHFRAYNAFIEAFNHLLYIEPGTEVAHEAHVRLGFAYKIQGEYERASKHLRSALEDLRENSLFSKAEIRFHIAHCYDGVGELKRAKELYKELIDDPEVKKDDRLAAAVLRAVAWVIFRIEGPAAHRGSRITEAINYLVESSKYDKENCRSDYYLGRCYSEIADKAIEKAHDAFSKYRNSIDKNETDPDVWCSIGVLYKFQKQAKDALQAFVCAIQINPSHSAAWCNLGVLYEEHYQFREALYCYKQSVKGDPPHPQPLKRRIQVLEKHIKENPAVFLKPRPANFRVPFEDIPPLAEARNLGIPANLRPQRLEFIKLQQFIYRAGYQCRMSELTATYSMRHPFDELNGVQKQIMNILGANEGSLAANENDLLRLLEERFRHNPANRERQQAATISDMKGANPDEMKPFPFLEQNDFDNIMADTMCDNPSTSYPYDPDEEPLNPPKGGELPTNFSLLAPIHVPITITATELMERCHTRLMNPDEFKPIFDESYPPPKPAVIPLKKRPAIDQLGLKTPLIKVDKLSDAAAPELQNFCYKSSIALIRGLTGVLKMDLGLFSTRTLMQTAPEYSVEVRSQYRMPGDINVDNLGHPSWKCYSARSGTTIGRYGVYQAESFRHSLKEETERLRAAGTGSKYAIAAAQAAAAGNPLGTIGTSAPTTSSFLNLAVATPDGAPPTKRRRAGQAAVNASAIQLAEAAVRAGGPDDLPTGHMPMKVVKFCTNVDLSDEAKFSAQLRELNKMPAFCRHTAPCNLLTHLGHSVLGMNTVQLYMKVPGCRTPGHLENNCFASININIGPGECEWFGVDYEYWPVIDKMCKERGLDLMKGSWWPNFEDLVKARVPVYRFTQRAGDVVWVGGGCVHWVQSTGWCNNVAWNVGPMTAEQIDMSLYAHEWNKLTNYRSLVPMQHLAWQLAQNVRFSNQRIFNCVKAILIRSLAYSRILVDFVEHRTKNQIKMQPRLRGEAAHYCHNCDIEVFNILFVREHHNKFNVFCVNCARKANFDEYIVLQQITFEELCDIFDRFQLHPAKTPLLC